MCPPPPIFQVKERDVRHIATVDTAVAVIVSELHDEWGACRMREEHVPLPTLPGPLNRRIADASARGLTQKDEKRCNCYGTNEPTVSSVSNSRNIQWFSPSGQ